MGLTGLLPRRTECILKTRTNISKGSPEHGAQAEPAMRWYALYARSRHEKRVHERLRLRNFESFLPTIPQERQWHDRKTVVEWPLFPGYVFVRFADGSTSEVLGTPGVVTIVRQSGAPAPIRDEVIDSVRRLEAVAAETGTMPAPTPIVLRGRRVRITAGPLAGAEGVIVQRRGADRVLVQVGVEAIGLGLKIEVALDSVRVFEEAA